MTIFVLTQTEGKVPVPVAAITSERTAQEWFRKKTGNDFFPLDLDRVDHLGFTSNGPDFTTSNVAPSANRFKLPAVPAITPDMDPAIAMRVFAEYIVKLTDSMEVIERALDR